MSNDFGTMEARIADELARTDLTSEITLAIQDAIKFYERERWYFTETSTAISTVAGTQTYNLPSDFKAMEYVTILVNGQYIQELRPRSFEYIRNITTITTIKGPSQDYCIYAQQLWLYPIPDQVYLVTEYYNQQLAQLSSATDTNAWMVDGEELIRTHAKWKLNAQVIRDYEEGERMRLLIFGDPSRGDEGIYANLKSSATLREVQGRVTPVYL